VDVVAALAGSGPLPAAGGGEAGLSHKVRDK